MTDRETDRQTDEQMDSTDALIYDFRAENEETQKTSGTGRMIYMKHTLYFAAVSNMNCIDYYTHCFI